MSPAGAPALRRARAAAQLLHRPRPAGAGEVVGRLLAVQAQDLRAARLALRARTAALTAADVDVALTDERSVVVAWLMRGTLHLVGRDDYPWLLGLTAPTRLSANRRRLAQEGVAPDDAERAVKIVERALADAGPLTRPELAQRIAAEGHPHRRPGHAAACSTSPRCVESRSSGRCARTAPTPSPSRATGSAPRRQASSRAPSATPRWPSSLAATWPRTARPPRRPRRLERPAAARCAVRAEGDRL